MMLLSIIFKKKKSNLCLFKWAVKCLSNSNCWLHSRSVSLTDGRARAHTHTRTFLFYSIKFSAYRILNSTNHNGICRFEFKIKLIRTYDRAAVSSLKIVILLLWILVCSSSQMIFLYSLLYSNEPDTHFNQVCMQNQQKWIEFN